jgi:hypothetical protein
MEFKSQKIKNERPTFWEINDASSDIEKARFCTNFLLLENRAKYCLDPQPELKSEPETEPKLFKSWNRKRNMQITTVPQHCAKIHVKMIRVELGFRR